MLLEWLAYRWPPEFSFSIWMFTDLQQAYIKSFFALDVMSFASPTSQNVNWHIESYWMIYTLDADRERKCLEKFTSCSFWPVKKDTYIYIDPSVYSPSSQIRFYLSSMLCDLWLDSFPSTDHIQFTGALKNMHFYY